MNARVEIACEDGGGSAPLSLVERDVGHVVEGIDRHPGASVGMGENAKEDERWSVELEHLYHLKPGH